MNVRARHWLTVPNLLTLTRIILTPFVAYSIAIGSWGVASILFFICTISDALDGLIARAFNQQTLLGACLDPIADKFFVSASFYALAVSSFSIVTVPVWFVYLMVVKELFLMLGVLFFCFGVQTPIQVNPSLYGKLAACTQMVSLFFIIIFSYFHMPLSISGPYLFVPLALIMLGAFFDYFCRALRLYKKEEV